jgi:hypothetical protein
LIPRGPLQHVVAGGKDGTGYGHQRSLGTAQCGEAAELGPRVGPFAFGGRPGSFAQCSAQPGITSPCGAVPSAVDPWPSWNDSPRRNSNSVLHHSRPQLHELTRSHPALATLQSVSPTCVSLPSRHPLSIPA